MNRMLMRSAVLGGIIVFVWGLVSWMLLPWHQVSIKGFKNEEKVASVLRENAPEKGVYLLPNMFVYDNKQVADVAQQKVEEGREKMERGPVVFAVVSPKGVSANMAGSFFTSVVINIVGAFIIAWVLSHLAVGFWRYVRFVTVMGLTVGVLGLLPLWNWWNFPVDYVVVAILDLIIGWFLAGMVMAKFRVKELAD